MKKHFTDVPRFAFGENWQQFVPVVDEYRVERAKNSLVSFFDLPDLKGKSFLDIGSGSGLFSYAAHLLGAAKVMSFDYDPRSVAATTALWEKAGKPSSWTLVEGSALDATYLQTLPTFDIVYSWGVLHHTGAMWDAIEKTAKLTAPHGLYCIALYNRAEGRFGSTFWLSVKKAYNRGSWFTKKIIEWVYAFVYYILAPLFRGKNPIRFMDEYKKKRGMHPMRDVADWVGGYPYEYASVDEVFTFMKKTHPRFRLVNIKTVSGIGNNWFLFRNET